jgi:hypothetical protein
MTSYRIIGGDQKEYGPATADEIRAWIAEGRANGQTQVRQEGSTEWRPLSSFAEFSGSLSTQSSGSAGPVTAPLRGSSQRLTAEVLAARPHLEIARCLSLSWDLLRTNFGLLFGATFVVWLFGAVCQFVPTVSGMAVGVLVGLMQWLLSGILYGGVYLVFLKRIRGDPATLNDAFTGFGAAAGQLMLTSFVRALLTKIGLCCLLLPGIYLSVAWVLSIPLVADKHLEFWSAMELSRKAVTRIWFPMLGLILLAFLPFIVGMLFVVASVSLEMMPATEASIRELLSSGGLDPAKIVEIVTRMQMTRPSVFLTLLPHLFLLLNLPFALGALMYAYEDLFGARATPSA